jgi:hypothetical protein
MKRAKRGLMCWILAVLVFVSVSACIRTEPLFVSVDPPIGHPTAEAGGLAIRVKCSGGQPPYCIDFGDGTEVVTNTGTAQHTYCAPFDTASYRIVATCDSGRGSTSVQVENQAPVFHGIFSVKGQRAAEKEMVLLQVNHFVKGCRDCPPCDQYQVFGGEDPDGDTLFYEWHIKRDGGYREDSVFDLSGNRVDGIPTPGEYFVWFPLWQESQPLLPMDLAARNHALENVFESWIPKADPSPMGFYRTYTLRVIVSDYCGASNTFTTKWEVLEIDN